MSFSISSLECMVERRLKLVPTCALFYMLVIAGEIMRKNTMYEYVRGYEMRPVEMESAGKGKYGGD